MIYRGKLKVFSKLLNNLHLNILANFSEITKFEEEISNSKELITDYENLLVDIYADLKNFFKVRKNNKKRIEDFIFMKDSELEIHEIIVRTYSNLSKSDNVFSLLLEDSCILEDIILYMCKFNGEVKTKENKEFLRSHLEKKNKDNNEQRKLILSVLENTINIFINLTKKGELNKHDFRLFVTSLSANPSTKITKNYIISGIKGALENIKTYQMFSSKLEQLATEAIDLLEKNWS